MQTLPYAMILLLTISGCAGGATKTQEQIYADAIAQPEFIAERAKVQAEAQAREDARAEAEERERGIASKLQAEKQAKTDAENKAKEDARQKAEAARLAEAEARKIAENEAKNKENAALVAEYKKVKPKCLEIRFTGIATPQKYSLSSMTYYREPDAFIRRVTLPEISDFYTNPITRALASNDIEDTLAKNPILCEFYVNGRGGCKGVAYFENKKGTITEWWKDFYVIDTTLDFNTGRKSIYLIILRKDARCAK